MKANQASYPVTRMCRVLGVSTSGFYAWLGRGPSKRDLRDAELLKEIKEVHKWSRGTYGAPRMHAELVDREIEAGRDRIARVMREAGIQGVSRRRGTKTTIPGRAPAAPDLVDRDFRAKSPDELWVADITYIPSWTGFLYLAVVIDAWSRRVVGWSMATHLRKELVLDALNMAIAKRRPDSVIHHSDRGSQYTSLAFGKRCEAFGVRVSMGSVGDAYDNALAESFFASLECELIDRCSFKTRPEARIAVFEYIEAWYNPHRRHSALGQVSPVNFEKRHEMARAA